MNQLGARVRERQAAMPQNIGAELDPQRIGVRTMGQTKRVSRSQTEPYRSVWPKARST